MGWGRSPAHFSTWAFKTFFPTIFYFLCFFLFFFPKSLVSPWKIALAFYRILKIALAFYRTFRMRQWKLPGHSLPKVNFPQEFGVNLPLPFLYTNVCVCVGVFVCTFKKCWYGSYSRYCFVLCFFYLTCIVFLFLCQCSMLNYWVAIVFNS